MANGQMGRNKSAPASQEKKMRDNLAKLEVKYSKARELLEKSGGGLDSQRMKGTQVLLSKIDALKKEIKDKFGSASTPKPRSQRAPDKPRSQRAPELTNSGRVGAAPRPRSEQEGKELASRAAERRAGSGPDRPSTPDTRSKKPIAKRLMESLGDKRTMAQATRDREENERLERETMGRKKGGMAQKNKSTVKKAYGGTVKKKQGGSANKVNMKAGFTRRGCAKG